MIVCKICGKEAEIFLGNGFGICKKCFEEYRYYSICTKCGRYFYKDKNAIKLDICPICILDKKRIKK